MSTICKDAPIMKILLIIADAHMHKLRVGVCPLDARKRRFRWSRWPLWRPRATSEWRLIDGSIEPIPWMLERIWWDQRPYRTATGAYRVADHFVGAACRSSWRRARFAFAGEALRHADAIVVGMAERTGRASSPISGTAKWRESIAMRSRAASGSPACHPRRDLCGAAAT